MIDVDEMVDELDQIIAEHPGKFFSWETPSHKDRMCFSTGVTYAEWMLWTRERKCEFVRGLDLIFRGARKH